MPELKRNKNLDRDEEGVATTVGTIMALLIFLSVLSLITQQYVPVWMHDNEAYHMQEVRGEFADFKRSIDNLAEDRNYPQYHSQYSSLKLGTDGIPIFASATPGRVTYEPGNESSQMSLRFFSEDENRFLSRNSSGNFRYRARNREFEDQSLIYEHGAIILEQEDKSVMRARPQLYIDEDSVSMTMINFVGSSEDISGNGRVDINIERAGLDTTTHPVDEDEDFNLTIDTPYTTAWANYLENETSLGSDEVESGEDSVEIRDYTPDEINLTRLSVKVDITV